MENQLAARTERWLATWAARMRYGQPTDDLAAQASVLIADLRDAADIDRGNPYPPVPPSPPGSSSPGSPLTPPAFTPQAKTSPAPETVNA